jgi:hypothetical protein
LDSCFAGERLRFDHNLAQATVEAYPRGWPLPQLDDAFEPQKATTLEAQRRELERGAMYWMRKNFG